MDKYIYKIDKISGEEYPHILRKKENKIESWSTGRPYWRHAQDEAGAFIGTDTDYSNIDENKALELIEKWTKQPR